MPKYGHLFFPLNSRMTFNLRKCIADANYRQGELYEFDEPRFMEVPGRAGLQVEYGRFAKHFSDADLLQLPQDVRILSVGFYTEEL